MAKDRKYFEDKIYNFITNLCSGDKRNTDVYKEAFSKMTDKEFFEYISKLSVPGREGKKLTIQAPNFDNSFITIENNLKIAKDIGCPLYESLWITPEDGGPTYLTPTKYLILKLPIRRQAQFLIKKIAIPENNRVVDKMSGQPTGPSKGSSISFPEVQIINSRGYNYTLVEWMKFRGGDEGGFKAMNTSIARTGYAKQSEITQFSTGVNSTFTLSAILTASHLANTLGKH